MTALPKLATKSAFCRSGAGDCMLASTFPSTKAQRAGWPLACHSMYCCSAQAFAGSCCLTSRQISLSQCCRLPSWPPTPPVATAEASTGPHRFGEARSSGSDGAVQALVPLAVLAPHLLVQRLVTDGLKHPSQVSKAHKQQPAMPCQLVLLWWHARSCDCPARDMAN